jgi:pilus assembly protein CpaC
VRYDLQAIQDFIEQLFPGEDVKVGAIHDQIVLTGTASTPEKSSKIANVVGHYVSDLQDEDKSTDELISNLLEVRGEQQVMLQVKIVEANRSILKELGVETVLNDGDELSTSTIFGNQPPNSVENIKDSSFALGTDIGLVEDPLAIGRLLADTGIAGIGSIGLFLSALEEENLVNVLAEPNLTAVSGEQAGFLAGGEFPVPVGRDNVGNIVIEFREFGVSLNFRPIVLSDKRISLQMNTEVSSLDFENAVTLADLTVPGLDIRRADTTVEMPSGGSLMIAGLLQSEAVKGMSGLPGIAKTPVLGDLVSSDSFQRNETELVVIVTPYLVEPYAEKERAQPVPEHASNPLAKAFSANLIRAFDMKDEEIFAGSENFGYLLD